VQLVGTDATVNCSDEYHMSGDLSNLRSSLAQASGESLNPFLALGRHVSSDLRLALSKALRTAPLKSVDVFM
jgi:hypothetical protein